MKEDVLHSALKDVQLFGDFESHKAEIDAEDLSWILQILSTNLYSDPIGSLIREYSSNAWDANVEAGNAHKPIEVGIMTTADNGSYWYVTDLGPGLSPHRINTVYRKFGKSTKRQSNEAIGMMGLGKFSGLSYTNEVFITTRVDGMQYEYLMHKSDGVPQIDLLITKLTDLPNGTTIKVNIKTWSEKRDFIRKTQEQLAFFENVFFNIDSEAHLNDKFKIVKAKTFTYSSLEGRDLRLKIGPVSYPIDWDVIEHKVLKDLSYDMSSIAINFNIGELAITPNRESILYNKATIDSITKRFAEVEQELLDLYNNLAHEYDEDHLEAFITAINKPSINLPNTSKVINVQRLLIHHNAVHKSPMLKNLPIVIQVDNYQSLFYGYNINSTINQGRKAPSKTWTRGVKVMNPNEPSYQGNYYKFARINTTSLDPTRTKYLYETTGHKNWEILRRNKTVRLFAKDLITKEPCYYNYLNLRRVPRSKWRETIKAFQDWQDQYVAKHTVDYDAIVPTKQWLLAQKKQSNNAHDAASLRKATGKILVKIPDTSHVYYNSCTFRNTDWPINKLHTRREFTIYGTEDDKAILTKLHLFSALTKPKTKVIITAKSNHKYFSALPNFMNVEEFMKGKNKYHAYFASLFRLNLIYEEYQDLFQSAELVQKVNTPMYEVLVKIDLYLKEYNRIFHKQGGYRMKDMIQPMIDTAISVNYLDWEIEELINQLQKGYTKFSFLCLIAHESGSSNYNKKNIGSINYNREQTDFAIEVCRYKKVRMDTKYYVKNDGRTEDQIEQ